MISDQGISGLVIHTHLLSRVKITGQDRDLLIEAEAGALKSEVLKHFIKFRLPPAVFLAGLPGDVAGGVVMNAGVGQKIVPREFCEIVRQFEVVRLNDKGECETQTFYHQEIDWTYRRSRKWQPGVITRVVLGWKNDPDEKILQEVRLGNKRRKDSQPLSQPSCGSVFKNPLGDHAGRLIEAAGLKGYSIGGAQVSEKHANFIVNTGNATALDIHRVMEFVQNKVQEKFQVELTNEVVYMGEWG